MPHETKQCHSIARCSALVFAALLAAVPAAAEPYDFSPIKYESTPAGDPVARLAQRIEAAEAALEHDDRHGYLRSLLEQLNVSRSSQLLVFSKTSFQLRQISPATPRAIYYNDDVYIGWVQGGEVIEISSVDPQLGGVFYTLDQRRSPRPKLVRRTGECLQCHNSSMTQSVPGHLVRSVTVDEAGFVQLRAGSEATNHRTPLSQRWGGWYVTGTHGRQTHMGNAVWRGEEDSYGNVTIADPKVGANVTDLSDRIKTAAYLTPHSDIVALMVLEHQTHMHNLITRASYQTRIALAQEAQINRILGRDEQSISPTTQQRIERAGDALLRSLLLIDQEVFEDPIAGTSDFATEFQQRGPRDRQGRSLRDLDLNRWLFEYPCSYLIYSEAFDALPQPVADYVYRRLWQILSGADESGEFDDVSTADRRAILEILLDTKANLPDYWRRTQ